MAAEKVEGEVMSSQEKTSTSRIYTVPLGRAWVSPRRHRTKRAINMIREFAMRHMKSSEVKIDQGLSEEIWSRGIEKPPRRITVKMDKGEDGIVTVSHLPIDNKTTIKESKPASQAEVKESKPASQAEVKESKPASQAEVKDTVTDSETEGVSKDSSSLEQGKSG